MAEVTAVIDLTRQVCAAVDRGDIASLGALLQGRDRALRAFAEAVRCGNGPTEAEVTELRALNGMARTLVCGARTRALEELASHTSSRSAARFYGAAPGSSARCVDQTG